ncbi:MAG TPA: extracellular solute-binding protein [Candidatus Acidoferrum sp.]|nr:extracellular solute-binding protein [Candidatus Acidoferrum sp.]
MAKANSEGSVTLYTPPPQTKVDAWTTGFAKAFPKIKLSVFTASPGQILAKLSADQQGGTGVADVLALSQDSPTSAMATYDSQGQLVPLTGPNFQLPDMKAAIASPNRFYVYATVFGWAWNTHLLPNGIHSWKDFLAPGLANGKIAVWDPSPAPILPAYYEGQVTASGDSNWLKDLAAQKPNIYSTSVAMENAVASGEVAATLFASQRVLTLKSQGAPVDFAIPATGAGVSFLEGGVSKSAPHPYAAQVLANWLASVEGQQAVEVTGTPARANVPGSTGEFAKLMPTKLISQTDANAFVNQFNSMFHK